MTGESESLMSVRDAARHCGKNPETVRRWVWSGRLPAEKLGNQLFIRKADLDRFCGGAPAEPFRGDVASVPPAGEEREATSTQTDSAPPEHETRPVPGSRGSTIQAMRRLREEVRAVVGDFEITETMVQLGEER